MTDGGIAGDRLAGVATGLTVCRAWARWLGTPLILVPVWTRRPSHAAAVAGWFAVDSSLPGPADERAPLDRALLDEERRTVERPRANAPTAISVVTSVAAGAALVAARRRHLSAVVGATVVWKALTLAYWEMMSRSMRGRPGR